MVKDKWRTLIEKNFLWKNSADIVWKNFTLNLGIIMRFT